MNKLKWITVALAVMMVLLALAGAGMDAQEAGGVLAVAAGLAVVLSWLIGKVEKPLRLLVLSIGVSSAIAVCVLLNSADALKRFALILGLLLAIIWLVGSMIRRHLTERE